MASIIFPREKIGEYATIIAGSVGTFFIVLMFAIGAMIFAGAYAPVVSVSVFGHEIYHNPSGMDNAVRAVNSITTDYVITMLALLFVFLFDFISGAFLSDRLVKSFGIQEGSDASAVLFFFPAFLWWLPVILLWTWIFPGSIVSIFDPFKVLTGFILLAMVLDVALNIKIQKTEQIMSGSV